MHTAHVHTHTNMFYIVQKVSHLEAQVLYVYNSADFFTCHTPIIIYNLYIYTHTHTYTARTVDRDKGEHLYSVAHEVI